MPHPRAVATSREPQPSLDFEQSLWQEGVSPVAGVDEAGRGPLAGPVVAAAVILPSTFNHPTLNDSKRLSAATRERIFQELVVFHGLTWSVGICTPEEVDRYNILRATHRAMALALEGLSIRPAHALIDGLPVRGLAVPQTALVGGDSLSLSIAAASVIAKVTRDQLMHEFDAQFPRYGFARHKGYGTREHLEKLAELGPCPIHRRSFAPVAQTTLPFGPG